MVGVGLVDGVVEGQSHNSFILLIVSPMNKCNDLNYPFLSGII